MCSELPVPTGTCTPARVCCVKTNESGGECTQKVLAENKRQPLSIQMIEVGFPGTTLFRGPPFSGDHPSPGTTLSHSLGRWSSVQQQPKFNSPSSTAHAGGGCIAGNRSARLNVLSDCLSVKRVLRRIDGDPDVGQLLYRKWRPANPSPGGVYPEPIATAT